MTVEKYLAGKLAIITGAGKTNGIGYAIALALAQHGADIVLHYNTNREAAEQNTQALCKLGIQAVAVQGDASQANFGANVVRATIESFPGRAIDIVVNNAAVVQFAASASGTLLDSFDNLFHTNVRAPFTLMQAAVPHMASPGGRIVNVGSVAGAIGSQFGPFYAASKAALNNLSRSFAEELGPKGITVNTIAPGPIATDVVPPEDHVLTQRFRMDQFIKRNGIPEEVSVAVLFVAHPANNFYTGQMLVIDGGMSY